MNDVALLIDGRSTAALGSGTFQRMDPVKGSPPAPQRCSNWREGSAPIFGRCGHEAAVNAGCRDVHEPMTNLHVDGANCCA